jgi:hypothetical protein
MLASRAWANPQREWLQKIAAQTKANVIVDRDALDDADLVFKRESGGYVRLTPSSAASFRTCWKPSMMRSGSGRPLERRRA